MPEDVNGRVVGCRRVGDKHTLQLRDVATDIHRRIGSDRGRGREEGTQSDKKQGGFLGSLITTFDKFKDFL